MKRTLLTLGMIIGLGLLSSLAWVGISHATNLRSGDTPSVSRSETVDGSLYIAGRSVTIDGTVKGDVFCAGQDVFVTGTVEGDVICAGQFVRITGSVQGDVRAAGMQVDVSATIDGSMTLAGQTVYIKPETKVGRDVSLGSESARVDGQIGRDLLGGSQTIILNATVGRDVLVEVQNVSLEPKAVVGGNFHYRSPNKAVVTDSAKVAGETRHEVTQPTQQYDNAAVKVWSTIFGFCSLLLIGALGILAAPRWMDGVGAAIRNRPIGAFGFGATALFAVPIVAGLLMMTFIGLQLALIMLCLWIAALLAALVFSAYALGWIVVEKLAWPSRGQRLASLVLGLLIFALIGLIPVVGGLVVFVALVYGLGGLAVALFTRLRPMVKTPKHKKASSAE